MKDWLREQTTEALIQCRKSVLGEMRSDIDAELIRRGEQIAEAA